MFLQYGRSPLLEAGRLGDVETLQFLLVAGIGGRCRDSVRKDHSYRTLRSERFIPEQSKFFAHCQLQREILLY